MCTYCNSKANVHACIARTAINSPAYGNSGAQPSRTDASRALALSGGAPTVGRGVYGRAYAHHIRHGNGTPSVSAARLTECQQTGGRPCSLSAIQQNGAAGVGRRTVSDLLRCRGTDRSLYCGRRLHALSAHLKAPSDSATSAAAAATAAVAAAAASIIIKIAHACSGVRSAVGAVISCADLSQSKHTASS